jgi:alpha-galactosidase
MSSWVSDEPGHRDRRSVSLGYRFAVAMSGVLGIGSDLLDWSGEARAEAQAMVSAYKELRSVIHHGDVTVHGHPDAPLYCLEFRGPDTDPRTVLLVFDADRDRHRDLERPRVFPTALREGIRYSVRSARVDAGPHHEATTAPGARSAGVAVPFAWSDDADVLILDPCTE